MSEIININKPVLKAESGLLLDPSLIEHKQKELQKTSADLVVEKYNTRYNNNLNAPTPNIKVPYNGVLTKAVPPKMDGYSESGLLINKLDVDVRMAKKLEIMSENVSDEQLVMLTGNLVESSVVEPGDTVRINFDRYRKVKDDHARGVAEMYYEIPLYEIDGYEYLLIDARDIIYTIPSEVNKNNAKEKWDTAINQMKIGKTSTGSTNRRK